MGKPSLKKTVVVGKEGVIENSFMFAGTPDSTPYTVTAYVPPSLSAFESSGSIVTDSTVVERETDDQIGG